MTPVDRLEQAELELRATIDHQLELPAFPLGAGEAGHVREPSAARAE